MKVFITGHCGYLGAAFCQRYGDTYELVGYDFQEGDNLHDLDRKFQTIALRFGPINKQFLGTSVSIENATQAIDCALRSTEEFWYEPFSIADNLEHIDTNRAQQRLGYAPEPVEYSGDQIHSALPDRAK